MKAPGVKAVLAQPLTLELILILALIRAEAARGPVLVEAARGRQAWLLRAPPPGAWAGLRLRLAAGWAICCRMARLKSIGAHARLRFAFQVVHGAALGPLYTTRGLAGCWLPGLRWRRLGVIGCLGMTPGAHIAAASGRRLGQRRPGQRQRRAGQLPCTRG